MISTALLLALAFQAHDGSSGGALTPEQAAYDVLHYDLELTVDPDAKSIAGTLTAVVGVLSPLTDLVLDLDDALTVDHVHAGELELPFEHAGGVLRIELDRTRAAGTKLAVAITYGGRPHEAVRPPWGGGFTWAETPSGEPWIATSCQQEGADLWWPCKDHPADEPDGMDLHIRVPRPLVVATNGKLSQREIDGDWWTWHWHVSTPINNYGVALNIAPYVELQTDYTSVTGEPLPVTFFVLPTSVESGRAFLPEIVEHLRWYEETFGPYPFRADKYAVVETPHLGMEHQTIIAYGNEFRTDWRGFDWLHHHELAHEWWGNLVTVADWKDFWIHEGFATYCQNLYGEHLGGAAALEESVRKIRGYLNNVKPVVPATACTTREIYFMPDGTGSDNDVYYKGALVLHTLRWLIGDEPFFRSMRRMSYPDSALERVEDGSACRFTTTSEFVAIVEDEAGHELDWFFDVYLHRAELPALVVEAADASASTDTTLEIHWEAPDGLDFPMPVEVRIAGESKRLAPGEVLSFPRGSDVEIDPASWVLRAE